MTTSTATTTVAAPTTGATGPTGERADLLESLARHRFFLRHTVAGLTDEQASRHTTVSRLTLGGLIKHVSIVEQMWADFIVAGPQAFAGGWGDGFVLLPGETLAGALARYEEVATRTDELVVSLADLDVSHPLPEAPWFPPGARWSARRALLHIIAETAQHAGHADIIRESLDGAKTMG